MRRPKRSANSNGNSCGPTTRVGRRSRFCGLPEEAEIDRQPRTGSMRGRKQNARHEGKVIDEEAEFRLTSAPMRRTVKRKSEEKHVSRRKQCGFGEESSGQEANGQRQLEQRSQPGKKLRNGEAGRRDKSRRAVDIHHLECQCHEENRSENQASYENGCGCPRGGL